MARIRRADPTARGEGRQRGWAELTAIEDLAQRFRHFLEDHADNPLVMSDKPKWLKRFAERAGADPEDLAKQLGFRWE